MKYSLCFGLVFACFLRFGIADIRPNDINYVFYSRDQFSGYRFNIDDDPDLKFLDLFFDPNQPTVVLIHGWQDDFSADSNTYVREAILSKTSANIFKVDWGTLAFKGYTESKAAVPFVGRFAGQLLRTISNRFGYLSRDITLVGFSLGAHIAGNIGKYLRGQVGLIIALDPAGPFIDSKDIDFSINPADAEYVQVIHTNAGLLGMADVVGHADFYPNGGSRQPGCGLDLLGGCAHNRAWAYFAESVTNNRFVSKQCNSWDDYKKNICSENRRLMGGLSKVDKNSRGVFYLETNNVSPYARG